MKIKRLVGLFISIGLLIYIYTGVNIPDLINTAKKIDVVIFLSSFIFYFMSIYISSIRLESLHTYNSKVLLKDYQKLILSANTLNFILPAKMGDISKAYFMKKNYNINSSGAICSVIVEKVGDLIGLSVCCLMGFLTLGNLSSLHMPYIIVVSLILFTGIILLLSEKTSDLIFTALHFLLPKKTNKRIKHFNLQWSISLKDFREKNSTFLRFAFLSILNSYLHLLGIWVMFISIDSTLPVTLCMALTPIAILSAFFPFTVSGIGIRDMTLISLFSLYVGNEISTLFGFLFTLRLIIYAIIGLPFLNKELLNNSI
jgi:uncharacterized protein (TIRG00374 family)